MAAAMMTLAQAIARGWANHGVEMTPAEVIDKAAARCPAAVLVDGELTEVSEAAHRELVRELCDELKSLRAMHHTQINRDLARRQPVEVATPRPSLAARIRQWCDGVLDRLGIERIRR